MCSAMNSWLSCEALLLPRNDADCFLMTDVIVSDKSSLCDTVGRIIQHEHINVRFVGMTRMERVGMGGEKAGRTKLGEFYYLRMQPGMGGIDPVGTSDRLQHEQQLPLPVVYLGGRQMGLDPVRCEHLQRPQETFRMTQRVGNLQRRKNYSAG